MAGDTKLTAADLAAIESQFATSKMTTWANPPLRPLSGPAKEMADAHAAKLEERRAAAREAEERAAAERARTAERQAAEWERTAPARKAALEHAALLRPKLAEAQARLDAIEAELYETERTATT